MKSKDPSATKAKDSAASADDLTQGHAQTVEGDTDGLRVRGINVSDARSTRLLVVDDNEINCDLLTRRLSRRGFETTTAMSGVAALDALEEDEFDLVLLDVTMPGMDGLEVLSRIRQRYALADLPVLMTTAQKDSDVVIEALSLGANDYLTKPLDFPILLARIETQLRLSQHAPKDLSTGEFSRIKGRRRHKLFADRFCPRCATCLRRTNERCNECGSPAPDRGWPEIGTSEFPHLGRTLAGRFFVERFIGRGAAGDVYRARDVDLNRKFAAKIVDLGADPHHAVRSRLESEIDAMAALTNPHVVKIYEVTQLDDTAFALIMDYVAGNTLATILDRVGQLEPWLALDVIRQTAQGLHEAHQHGMIHRDVKPDNIMLEKLPAGGYHARILDFGIVLELGKSRDESGFFGTPLYMSPEHFNDDLELDHRADIYSLGTVLYEMLTGQPPFAATSVVGILNKHMNEPVPHLREHLGDHPHIEALNRLLSGMLAKTPNSRFDSLFDVIRSVDKLLPSLVTDHEVELPNVNESTTLAPSVGGSTLVTDKTPGVVQLHQPLNFVRDESIPIALAPDAQLVGAKVLGDLCRLVHVDFPQGRVRKLEIPATAGQVVVGIGNQGGRAIVCGTSPARGVIFDLTTGHTVQEFWLPDAEVTAVDLSPDGSLAVLGDTDGRLHVLEGGEVTVLTEGRAPVTCVAVSPRVSEVAIGHADCTVEVRPLEPGGLRTTLPPLPFVAQHVAFNGVADLGAVLSRDKHISLFLPLGGAIVNQLEFAFASVVTLSFDAQDRLCCLESKDGTLRLWDIQRLFEGAAGRTTVVKHAPVEPSGEE